jgi:hypothetical protein
MSIDVHKVYIQRQEIVKPPAVDAAESEIRIRGVEGSTVERHGLTRVECAFNPLVIPNPL